MSKYLLNSDNYETPAWAIEEFVKGLDLKPGERIWSPFRGNIGNNVKTLKKLNIEVVDNDSIDFFDYEPETWDLILDNPPFSIKNRIVRRALSFKKPVILILPLLCARNKWVKKLCQEFQADLTLAMPSKRIQYEMNGEPTYWNLQETAWFCWNCGDRFRGKSGVIHL